MNSGGNAWSVLQEHVYKQQRTLPVGKLRLDMPRADFQQITKATNVNSGFPVEA